MSFGRQFKQLLLVLGAVFLVFELFIAISYASRLNSDVSWGERYLLYDLGFIALGIVFELLGLGLIVLGKEARQSSS
jgi:hypothetical protein